ncbi:Hypothetical protein Minf_2307 [Methylacidiphilum infernorum V4]|uniref:Uncharacterized protein n=1 Tax=Methylacidiphilum infernorum (isolate V4) TaxID=481448 RepID=B3E0D2_METI4|nr:Hypothetical protein Minf_2307 [Methylacidiphilum infernorum V4]
MAVERNSLGIRIKKFCSFLGYSFIAYGRAKEKG